MSRPWMPFYVADYLADTGHLSTIEHGAYLLLIMHYWAKGSLPDDDKRLASIARASPEQWSDMRSTIAEFFGDGWKHARIDEELEAAAKAYERRAAAGRAGGKAKAISKQCSSNAKAGLKQSQPQPSKEKEEPSGSSKKRACKIPDDFEPDIDVAIEIGLTPSEAIFEAKRMRDWSLGAPGQKGHKEDWPATWRNWCRRIIAERREKRATAPPKKLTQGESIRNMARQKGIIDDTGAPIQHLEVGDRDREGPGSGDIVRLAIAGNNGW